MGKSLIWALALSGLSVSAQAADLGLDSSKDPLPETLNWQGITVYGTIDVGYAYQTNGVPLNGSFPAGLEYNALTTSRNFTGRSISTLAENGLSQSSLGIKVEEAIGMGFVAIGKLDTGFEPLSGELADACRAMLQNVGKSPAQQSANGDYSRCGQALNGVAYGGVSSTAYGTLTGGRQTSLQVDALATYDPQALSYAFSIFGYSGATGGAGSTEAARWDNSVKYLYQYGQLHAAVMHSDGGEDTGFFGAAWGADIGFSYRGLSVDANYEKVDGAVNLLNVAKDPANATSLAAFVSNNEAWNVMGKYTFDLGGGFKEEGPAAKLTMFAGYSHNDRSNSSDTGTGAQGAYPISVKSDFLQSDLILRLAWAGVKYETGPWSFTGAYYNAGQNRYKINPALPGGGVCPSGGNSGLQCAGTMNQGSFVIDYSFTKHFDVYGGVNYSVVGGGFANGFQGAPSSVSQTTIMTGMRLKF